LLAAISAKLQKLAQTKEVDFDPAVDDSKMTSNGEKEDPIKITPNTDPRGEHTISGCLVELGHSIFNLEQLSLKDQDYVVKSTTKDVSINFNICDFTS
jgi:hypothetical protein